MLLQYPNANSTENNPIEGKKDKGLSACLKMFPTSAGSSLDTTRGISAYFLAIGLAVWGDSVMKYFFLVSVIVRSKFNETFFYESDFSSMYKNG